MLTYRVREHNKHDYQKQQETRKNVEQIKQNKKEL